MALSDQGKAALVYWGEIQAGVTQRATTADIWAAIRGAAAEAGLDRPGVTLQGVNEVRSAAAQIRNSGAVLGKAREVSDRTGLAQGIDSSMMSVAPWSRDPQVLQTLSDYTVRFQIQTVDANGETQTTWLTNLYPGGTLPATVGELVDSLGSYGQLSGSAPQGDFAGIGDIQILAV